MLKLEHESSLKHYIDKFNLTKIFSSKFRKNIELHCFRKNEFIIDNNNDLNYLYFLVEGSINIIDNIDDTSNFINQYENISILGALEIFLDKKLNYSIIANDDCICIAISRNDIIKFAFTDPEFLKFFCTIFTKKIYNNSFLNFFQKEKDAI
ncbi:cyclic nucleotide-binding domain-containing protein [Paraclostridium sordellii]|uniref:cyclic nucleotide-binding domain-containing protein n=1 Tax=Paraclostridium sordellii TaxID=1505 RepID=UPI0005E9B351|nr:cyclic nucleotide-binding domain-containing protein [Paeniclostridium sordellii]CEQ18873.1 transcriptional regulator [[Clostridium] sordellii] [Paeniclostridium sordellii]CEQ28532.1 transcriptional regulator [[Clostridium] sordellii] [Paeniclostridium sordellii]